MLTLTAFFLAANHVIGRSVEGVIPPVGLSFWRWWMGALILLPFVIPRFSLVLSCYAKAFRVYALLGCLMIGSTTLILVALNLTTAVNVSLMNAVQPALTVLLAVLFYRESVSGRGLLGIILAMAGVLVMVSRASWSLIASLEFNAGDLITVLAMFGFSSYALNLKKLPKELTVPESLFGITLFGSIALVPFYLIESQTFAPVPATAQTLWVVLALALLVSVLGNLMWNKGNQLIGPSAAAVFINLIPIFGSLLAISFLNEQLYLYHLIGALLICSGIGLVVTELGKG